MTCLVIIPTNSPAQDDVLDAIVGICRGNGYTTRVAYGSATDLIELIEGVDSVILFDHRVGLTISDSADVLERLMDPAL